MALWEKCTSYGRTERSTDMRKETEAEWQEWIKNRIDRAERNLPVRDSIDSPRNQDLKGYAYSLTGLARPCKPGEEPAPYGTEPEDFDFEGRPHDDIEGEYSATPIEKRKPYEQWFAERIARANRNRDEGKKPTASRVSDDALDHHESDYDIFMDSMWQQQGDGLVRDYLASDDSDVMSQLEGRHEWGLSGVEQDGKSESKIEQ